MDKCKKNRRARRRKPGNQCRSLLFEALEIRQLLTVNWRNPVEALDVSGDGLTVPLDVLLVINELNANGARQLSEQKDPAKPYWDPSGDQFIAPLDALQVINAINEGTASPFTLSEETAFESQARATITLGVAEGTRIYQVQINADFD